MKQLETMKARLEAREDDKCVQDEIERKLREKEERRRNVEKLRKERLKKQKEDKDEEMKIQKLNEGIRQAELVRIIVNYFIVLIYKTDVAHLVKKLKAALSAMIWLHSLL